MHIIAHKTFLFKDHHLNKRKNESFAIIFLTWWNLVYKNWSIYDQKKALYNKFFDEWSIKWLSKNQ
jgi:hypothetical protein